MGYMKEKQSEIFICVREKRSAETRNGKPYDNVLCRIRQERLTEKYGPNRGIADYDEKDL